MATEKRYVIKMIRTGWDAKPTPIVPILQMVQFCSPQIEVVHKGEKVETVPKISILMFSKIGTKDQVVVPDQLDPSIFVTFCRGLLLPQVEFDAMGVAQMLYYMDLFGVNPELGESIYNLLIKENVIDWDVAGAVCTISEMLKLKQDPQSYLGKMFELLKRDLNISQTKGINQDDALAGLFNTAKGRDLIKEIKTNKVRKSISNDDFASYVCSWIKRLATTEKPVNQKGVYDLLSLVNWFNMSADLAIKLQKELTDIDIKLPKRCMAYQKRHELIEKSKIPGKFSYKMGTCDYGDESYVVNVGNHQMPEYYELSTTDSKPVPILFKLEYKTNWSVINKNKTKREECNAIMITYHDEFITEKNVKVGVSLYCKRKKGGPWFPILTQWNWSFKRVSKKRRGYGTLTKINPLYLKTGSNTLENSDFKVVFHRIEMTENN